MRTGLVMYLSGAPRSEVRAGCGFNAERGHPSQSRSVTPDHCPRTVGPCPSRPNGVDGGRPRGHESTGNPHPRPPKTRSARKPNKLTRTPPLCKNTIRSRRVHAPPAFVACQPCRASDSSRGNSTSGRRRAPRGRRRRRGRATAPETFPKAGDFMTTSLIAADPKQRKRCLLYTSPSPRD